MEAAQAAVPDAANKALSITPEQRPRNEAPVMSQPDDGHSICSDGSIASSTTDINYMEHDDDTGGPYQEVRSRKRTRRINSNSSSETIIQPKAIEEGLTVVFTPADAETLITSLSSVKLSRALENSCPKGIHEGSLAQSKSPSGARFCQPMFFWVMYAFPSILFKKGPSTVEERDASREIRRGLDVIMPRKAKRTVVMSLATWWLPEGCSILRSEPAERLRVNGRRPTRRERWVDDINKDEDAATPLHHQAMMAEKRFCLESYFYNDKDPPTKRPPKALGLAKHFDDPGQDHLHTIGMKYAHATFVDPPRFYHQNNLGGVRKSYHTRHAQSVSRNTCPDLALARCGRWSEWSNLEVNLGSDHAIAQVDIAVSSGKKFLRKQALTDWDGFRAARTATHSEREHDDASLASWTECLVCDKNTYTETINLTTETPEVDRHLLHLWEAMHGLVKRWKRQKLNRKLKKRIAAITVEALDYATQLAQKLLKLGVHNTFRELVDSHLATQRDRLAQTPAGRKVLESLKIPFQWDREDTTAPLPRDIWSQIKVHTIPRNMDPTLHAERRKARARFYQKAYGQRADVLYTDAATYAYQRNAAAICVVDGTGSTRLTASLRTSNTTIAEEFAIAMAIGLEEDHVTIMSDSQAALRRFLAGRVSPKELKFLIQRDRQGFPTVELIWMPGHDEMKGNRCADTEARACTLRAAPATASRLGIDSYFIPVPNRYSEIRAYHRGQRREYPPPHKTLNRKDAVAWRQLQTGAFRNLALLHKFFPTSYKAECPHCGQYASLPHTTWFCTAHPNIPPSHPDPTPENWEAALLSSSAADQLKLIGRARLTADSVGALD
ncbi:hypothetical protein HPB47_027114 [Ixodes persulcatus]|uniref:Uncharacterized protein n=1 Tax=Ixodes persulcatus TaxID=34615 RepID=A0AC60PY81_IXOPE|nr:hypothetical protein HPB47_027114 [Ixodes persulcatus]